MRNLNEVNRFRVTDRRVLDHWGWAGDHTCGMFEIPSCKDKKTLAVIASSGEGWDHVSVSLKNRTPNYQEMQQVALLFFKPDETWMQLHVPVNDHINRHPHCLHWWRPTNAEIPRPPGEFV